MRTKTLREFLGWKCAWIEVPNKYEMILVWLPVWNPIVNHIVRNAQVLGRVIKGYWSGFMSECRGLRWNRKLRFLRK